MSLAKRLYDYQRLGIPRPKGLWVDQWGNLTTTFPKHRRKKKGKKRKKPTLRQPQRKHRRPKLTKLPYGERLPHEPDWLFLECQESDELAPWEED